MTEFYKLVFDLALYYTIGGYFTSLVFDTVPSAVGFLLLAAAVLLDAILRARTERRGLVKYLPLVLPVLTLIARPGIWQIVHILPAWAYLGWSFCTDRIETYYYEFQAHFSFSLKLHLLLLAGFPFWEKVPLALGRALPYLILLLAVGVCLLRMLREKQKQGVRQAIYIAIFIVLCAGLTLGQAPQALMRGFVQLYRNVLAPLFFGIAILAALAGYIIYLFLEWLISRRNGEITPPQINLQSVAEDLGIEEQYDAYLVDLSWLRPIGITIAAAIVIFALFLIFRKLLGDTRMETAEKSFSEQSERLMQRGGKKRKTGLLRPRNPRLAVRYYYAKFMEECRKRGLQYSEGMTAQELCRHSVRVFPGADPEELSRVYAPARYSSREVVTQADADRAAALWKELKQIKLKDE